MEPSLRSLIAQIHQQPYHCVLVATGGGAGAAGWLLSVPGGSRSILEVAVPYDEQSLCAFLGRRPDSFCSLETARALAARALDRARWLAPRQTIAGIACTASLRSDRPKHGEHRFHLAIQTISHLRTCSLTLSKDARDREEEERVLDLVFLNAMGEAFGIAERVPVPLLAGEQILSDAQTAEGALAAFFAGRVPVVCVESDGRMRPDAPRPPLLLCGSFNPLHAGHCALALAAARRTGMHVAFEMGIRNADKPTLLDEEVRHRLTQFAWRAPVWLTRAASFGEKAVLFPGTQFVVGADTAARIVQPRFYGDCESRMAEALGELRSLGCRFLVAGRLNAAGAFLGLDDLAIPAAHGDLFAALPASDFRMDLSSTQLRLASIPS